MSGKGDLKVLVKSAEDLAYALRDTLDVIADHEQRIKRLEKKLGFLLMWSRGLLRRLLLEGVGNEASALSQNY
jgi:hypothetical protein